MEERGWSVFTSRDPALMGWCVGQQYERVLDGWIHDLRLFFYFKFNFNFVLFLFLLFYFYFILFLFFLFHFLVFFVLHFILTLLQ